MISIPRNNCALDVARSATRKSPVLPYFAPVSDANPLPLTQSSPWFPLAADLSERKIVREPSPNKLSRRDTFGKTAHFSTQDACVRRSKKKICSNSRNCTLLYGFVIKKWWDSKKYTIRIRINTVPDDKEEFFVLENNSGRLCSPFTNPSFPSTFILRAPTRPQKHSRQRVQRSSFLKKRWTPTTSITVITLVGRWSNHESTSP